MSHEPVQAISKKKKMTTFGITRHTWKMSYEKGVHVVLTVQRSRTYFAGKYWKLKALAVLQEATIVIIFGHQSGPTACSAVGCLESACKRCLVWPAVDFTKLFLT